MLASRIVAGDHLPFVLRGGLVLHGMCGALLVRWIVTGRADARTARILSTATLRRVGQRSYGRYLWHWPIVVLLSPRMGDLARPLRDALVIAISLVLTPTSYELVEQRVRLRRAWARGASATFASAATVGLTLVAVTTAPSSAIPRRKPSSATPGASPAAQPPAQPPDDADADVDADAVRLPLWDSSFPVEQQRAAFAWFHDLVLADGAHLLFVTAPRVHADLVDPGMDGQVGVVAELVAEDPADSDVLDAASLWGDVVDVDMDDDGAPDHEPGQVHVCPQGAARFAAWLVDRLATRVDGPTPVFPCAWIGGDWSQDQRYDTPAGACAALPLVTG